MSDQLDKDWRDNIAQATKIAASLVPVIGGPLVELITVAIPRLRQDRIVEYLRQLKARLETLEKEKVEHILADVEKIDLIESGGFLAARATTSDRITKIAEIVFRGLREDEIDLIRRKRLLDLFGEIDDDEFLLLNAYGQSYPDLRSNAWDNIDQPPPITSGSSQEEIDRAELFNLGKQNLLRLGLFRHNYSHVKRGEYPPFDAQTGGFKSRIDISSLGRMLLKEAGIDLPY